MTKQERIDIINQRLNELDLLIQKIGRLYEILEHRVSSEENVEITFSPANKNASDEFIKSREKEIFKILDNVK